MKVYEQIFRTYDIREKFPEQLSPKIAFNIGKAIGSFFGLNKNIVIGGDVRISTPTIKSSLTNGLLSLGCNVLDVGMCTTPTIYFLSANNSLIHGGIMVTASHNPIDYNGIKVCDENGVSFHIDNLFIQIKEALKNNEFASVNKEEYGESISLKGINTSQYWQFQKNNFHPKKSLQIGVEIGNGTCYPILGLLKEKKFLVHALHSKPDGNFPVMIPDPSRPSCLKYLRNLVEEKNLDIGLGFDADGDRVGFIDNKAEIIKPDHVIMIFGKYLSAKYSNIQILIDVKTSRATFEYLSELGVDIRFTKVGHSWIHEELIKSGALFAGELSGHYYFGGDYYGFDDAIYSALKFIEIISSCKETTSEIVSKLPSYFSSEEMRIPCAEKIKHEVVSKVKTILEKEAKETILIDGVRAEFDDGWILVRESGTEPVISIRAEADTSKRLDFYQQYIEELVRIEIERTKKD